MVAGEIPRDSFVEWDLAEDTSSAEHRLANALWLRFRLAQNSEEWAHYHTMYRELRESWPVVPYKEEIRWLGRRLPSCEMSR